MCHTFQKFTKKKFTELSPTARHKNRVSVYITFTSLQTAIVQVKNQGGGYAYIHPIVTAINSQDEGVPRFIVGSYNIRSGNNTPVRVRPMSAWYHHQILLSFDDGSYNMESINAWKDEFMNWIRSDAIMDEFQYAPTFAFGGYCNDIDEPHYLAQHMLDGDVQDFVCLLYDNEEMIVLMDDNAIRIGCFGLNATSEEVASRILQNE